MKRILLPYFAFAATVSMAVAAPGDDVKAAAKKLADASNYSWSSTTQSAGGGGGGRGGFGGGPMSAVTEKGGYTVVTREFNGNAMQTVRMGEIGRAHV